MLNIENDTIIRVNPNKIAIAPRDIYVISSLEIVQELFKDAFIIPNVRWHRLINFYLKEYESFDISTLVGASYRKISDLEGGFKSNISDLADKMQGMHTVIPFTPSADMTKGVTDWKLNNGNLMEVKTKAFYNRYSITEAKNFMLLLLENSNAMSILLRGSLYTSPCSFCASMFNNISGECELFNTEEYHRQSCQPRIAFSSELINSEDISLDDKTDYSEILAHDFWKASSTKMEV